MTRRVMIGAIMLAVCAGAAGAVEVPQPSGQRVSLIDVIVEAAPPLVRFRFLAPDIAPAGGGLSYADVAGDFPYLCENVVLPAIQQAGLAVPDVIISLSDQVVPFGVAAPGATQFFEPYEIVDNACVGGLL